MDIKQIEERVRGERERMDKALFKSAKRRLLDDMDSLLARVKEYEAALQMIAGEKLCPDNLLGNADIARIVLSKGR